MAAARQKNLELALRRDGEHKRAVLGAGVLATGQGVSGDLIERNVRVRPHRSQAFVSVMRGCNMPCTYCIVPTTRGEEVSRPIGQIVDEAQRLCDDGVTEITLNVNGQERRATVEPRTTLLEVLRVQFNLTGAKPVSMDGSSGASTVLVDGKPVMASTTLAMAVRGKRIQTVESLGGAKPDAVCTSFVAHDASSQSNPAMNPPRRAQRRLTTCRLNADDSLNSRAGRYKRPWTAWSRANG